MIDHAGVHASDFARSRAFYTEALAPLGYTLLAEVPASLSGSVDFAGFGEAPKPDFWVVSGQVKPQPVHVAFRARSRTVVDAFHAAALAAGGTDNGAPGIRAHYHANYYGAFVHDPDGNNIEAVCHDPA